MALRVVRSVLCEATTEYGTKISPRLLEIHNRALRRADSYRTSESDVIDSLREVDDAKVYLHFELSSLYQYAVQILKLSEDVSCDLVAIMRKSRTVPELAAKIRCGSITASKARKLLSVITPETQADWLELASTQSKRVIEKAVATENPKAAVQESIRYKTAERLEFTIGVSEEWLAVLKDVKDLLSQEQRRSVTSEDALKAVMEEFRERHDPLRRAERAHRRLNREASEASKRAPDHEDDRRACASDQRLTKSWEKLGAVVGTAEVQASDKKKPEAKLSGPGRINAKRERLTAAIKNEVLLRDQRRCRFMHANGTRCEQRRWLDVHHMKPVSQGGGNEIENLITLCSSHHKRRHMSEGRTE